MAKKKFGAELVEIGDPKLGLTIDDAKFMAAHQQKGGTVPYSIYFTNAIGAAKSALNGFTSKVNLLPEKLKKRFFNEKMDMIIASSSILISVLCLMISGFILFKYQDLSFERRNLETKKGGIENTLYGTRYQDVQKALTALNDEVAMLSSIDNSLISVPAVLEDIYQYIPSSIIINAIQFDDADLVVEIEGIAETREQLVAIQEDLDAVKFISDVDIPLSSFDKKANIPFRMTLTLIFSELPNYGTSN